MRPYSFQKASTFKGHALFSDFSAAAGRVHMMHLSFVICTSSCGSLLVHIVVTVEVPM